jgi:hypothetical protein
LEYGYEDDLFILVCSCSVDFGPHFLVCLLLGGVKSMQIAVLVYASQLGLDFDG